MIDKSSAYGLQNPAGLNANFFYKKNKFIETELEPTGLPQTPLF